MFSKQLVLGWVFLIIFSLQILAIGLFLIQAENPSVFFSDKKFLIIYFPILNLLGIILLLKLKKVASIILSVNLIIRVIEISLTDAKTFMSLNVISGLVISAGVTIYSFYLAKKGILK